MEFYKINADKCSLTPYNRLLSEMPKAKRFIQRCQRNRIVQKILCERKIAVMCKAVNELFADEIKELKNIVADKDSLLADKDALIAKLQAQLEEYANQQS